LTSTIRLQLVTHNGGEVEAAEKNHTGTPGA